jgi:hypothetical protein
LEIYESDFDLFPIRLFTSLRRVLFPAGDLANDLQDGKFCPRATVRFHSFHLKTRLSASGPISVIPESRSE